MSTKRIGHVRLVCPATLVMALAACGGSVAPGPGHEGGDTNAANAPSGGAGAGSSGGASSSSSSGSSGSSDGGSSGSSGATSSSSSSSSSSGSSGDPKPPAPTSAPPVGTSFTANTSEQSLASSGAAYGQASHYTTTVDTTTTVDGQPAALLASQPGSSEYSWGQSASYRLIDSSYWGKRYRMHAKIKAQDAGTAYLYFEIDVPPASYVIDNMSIPTDRALHGTTDWVDVSMVLDVPQNASDFAFGTGLYGGGKVWSGPITFEEVDATVPTTPHGFGGASPGG